MKKIVMGIAAVAMAASVFAADVSAKVHFEGKLFNYDGKNVSAMNIDKPAGQNYNPILSLSAGDDVAGASFVVYNNAPAVEAAAKVKVDTTGLEGDAKKTAEAAGKAAQEAMDKQMGIEGKSTSTYIADTAKYQIWFKPIDNVKFIFGHQGFNLNQEQIEWWRSDSGVESQGYGINYSADGLSIDVALLPGWGKNWMTKDDGKDIAIGSTNVKVQYSADFGTVSAGLYASDTFKTLKFGAGYNNNIEGIYFFANVLGYVASEKFNKVRVEAFAKGSVDALGWAVFIPVDIDPNAKSDAAKVGIVAKGTYQLEACQAYLYINDGNVLAKDFSMTVKPGLTGSVGAASWEVAVEMGIAKTFTVGVPVAFNFGW